MAVRRLGFLALVCGFFVAACAIISGVDRLRVSADEGDGATPPFDASDGGIGHDATFSDRASDTPNTGVSCSTQSPCPNGTYCHYADRMCGTANPTGTCLDSSQPAECAAFGSYCACD